jgi:hypothetical protein
MDTQKLEGVLPLTISDFLLYGHLIDLVCKADSPALQNRQAGFEVLIDRTQNDTASIAE